MSAFKSNDLDAIIHGKLRLGVMAYLASVNSASFVTLREKTLSTDGNLSTHLKKLEDANYIKTEKRFEKCKPLTIIILTKTGRKAWITYLNKMQALLGGEM